MNSWRLLFHRPMREHRLLLEALLFLVWARVVVRLVPFRRIAPWIGQVQKETPAAIAPAERALAVEVSWAVQAAARHVPLGFVCLPQAMAAQRMLRRRGLPSTLYLGVSPDREKRDAIAAHAWLR